MSFGNTKRGKIRAEPCRHGSVGLPWGCREGKIADDRGRMGFTCTLRWRTNGHLPSRRGRPKRKPDGRLQREKVVGCQQQKEGLDACGCCSVNGFGKRKWLDRPKEPSGASLSEGLHSRNGRGLGHKKRIKNAGLLSVRKKGMGETIQRTKRSPLGADLWRSVHHTNQEVRQTHSPSAVGC